MVRLPYPDGSFRTIYADPPWWEVGGGRIRRGADAHYPLMKTPEIQAMGQEVRRVTGQNAHLYLWVTNNHLEDGLAVLRAWGFRYVTVITWGKDRFGLGQYYRGQTEHCLFGVRGVLPYRTRPDGKRAQGTTLLLSPRREHSRKPEEMRRWVELVSHPPYLELFARELRVGWRAWGVGLPELQPVLEGLPEAITNA